LSNIIRRRASSFEEHSLMSKAWEHRGLSLRAADALVDNGILTLDDLHRAHELELATIPSVGRKSLAVLYGLMGGERLAATKGHQAGLVPTRARIQQSTSRNHRLQKQGAWLGSHPRRACAVACEQSPQSWPRLGISLRRGSPTTPAAPATCWPRDLAQSRPVEVCRAQPAPVGLAQR
jgi:RNA polymerase alpha subunit